MLFRCKQDQNWLVYAHNKKSYRCTWPKGELVFAAVNDKRNYVLINFSTGEVAEFGRYGNLKNFTHIMRSFLEKVDENQG